MDPVALELPPALRELTAADAPFPGMLRGGDPPTVWTDAAVFGAGPAWAAVAAEHLLTAIDAAQTPDGPCVVLPHCPHTLADVLASASPLSPGAAVTVAVSLLRGAGEADALAAPTGRWWVTTTARPVLALTGGLEWRADTVAMLAALADDQVDPLADALRRAAATIDDPRLLRREAAGSEAELFALVHPGPLPLDRGPGTTAPAPGRSRTTPASDPGGLGGLVRTAVARLVDGGIADRVVTAGRSLRSFGIPRGAAGTADPRPPRGRRRVVLVAAAAAAGVVLAGSLWPAADDAPEASVGTAAGAMPRPTASPDQDAPAAPTDQPAEAGLVGVGRALLDAVTACGTGACAAELWERPGLAGPVTAAAGAYEIEVVDEYGGVAALRVTGAEATQVVVIVQDEKRWLVREVYDLADQP